MEEVTLDLLLDRVREAGVVGMGGGAAPTVQKLEQAAGKVDTVIINGAECEPYVTADHRLLLERSDPRSYRSLRSWPAAWGPSGGGGYRG